MKNTGDWLHLSKSEIECLRRSLATCEYIRREYRVRHGIDAESEADTAWLGLTEMLNTLDRNKNRICVG